MTVLLLDTNVVSILFNRNHALHKRCVEAVTGRQLVISFMTRAELLLWPMANKWGAQRRSALEQHMALYLTLYPDERTCLLWSEVVGSKPARRPAHNRGRCLDRFDGASVDVPAGYDRL